MIPSAPYTGHMDSGQLHSIKVDIDINWNVYHTDGERDVVWTVYRAFLRVIATANNKYHVLDTIGWR